MPCKINQQGFVVCETISSIVPSLWDQPFDFCFYRAIIILNIMETSFSCIVESNVWWFMFIWSAVWCLTSARLAVLCLIFCNTRLTRICCLRHKSSGNRCFWDHIYGIWYLVGPSGSLITLEDQPSGNWSLWDQTFNIWYLWDHPPGVWFFLMAFRNLLFY